MHRNWLIPIGLAGLAGLGGCAAKTGMGLIHPSTTFSYTAVVGQEELMVNTGDPANTPPDFGGSGSAFYSSLRGEHFFASQLGLFLHLMLGTADDVLEDISSSSSMDTLLAFFGVSYRATVDDDFRMPMRFGPYIHGAKVDGFGGGADVDYSTLGLMLSAEPEWIIFQKIAGERMSELTAFLEFHVGAGPSAVSDDTFDEEGYAFNLGGELGARYRFAFGMFIALSLMVQKTNYGVTDSYNDPVAFFGIDDDLLGVGVTVGGRF